MEHQHYSYSLQFKRILKDWHSSIGKETYFTIENYKSHPNLFPLYNISNPDGIRETDIVLDFHIRCPHCKKIHTCHVPDQSPEVEYLALFYTECTHCKQVFHLLSNFYIVIEPQESYFSCPMERIGGEHLPREDKRANILKHLHELENTHTSQIKTEIFSFIILIVIIALVFAIDKLIT